MIEYATQPVRKYTKENMDFNFLIRPIDLLGNYFRLSKLIMLQINDMRNPKRLRRLRYLFDVILNTLIFALMFSMRIRSREMR